MKFCPQCGAVLDGDTCSCGYKIGMTDEEYRELHPAEVNHDFVVGYDNMTPKFGMMDTYVNILPSLFTSYISGNKNKEFDQIFDDAINTFHISKESVIAFLNSFLELKTEEKARAYIDKLKK